MVLDALNTDLVSLLAPVLIPYCRSWARVILLYSAPVVLHMEHCMPRVRPISYISHNYKVERQQQRSTRMLKLKPMTEEKARTAWFKQRKRRPKCKPTAVCQEGNIFLWFSMFYPYKISESFKPSTFFPQLGHGSFVSVQRHFLSRGNFNFLSLWYKIWFDINHNCPKPFRFEKNNTKW